MLNRRLLMTQGGAEPPGEYTMVKYLEATGTQYILTNYSPSSKTNVQMTTMPYDAAGFSFGARLKYGNNSYGMYANSIDYGKSRTPFPPETTDITYVEVNADTLTAKINEEIRGMKEQVFTAPVPLAIFGMNTNGTVSGFSKFKITSFTAWEDGANILELKPAVRNLDGKPGLLNLADGKFYTNKGSGEFLWE